MRARPGHIHVSSLSRRELSRRRRRRWIAHLPVAPAAALIAAEAALVAGLWAERLL
jgi:hypothetical protein